MGKWLRNILTYKQSIIIIVVLISTLLGCSFVFRYKVKQIMDNEIRSSILVHAENELDFVNESFSNIIDIMSVASKSLSEEQFIGGINTINAIDSVAKVTGFVYVGIADINGNTLHGFPLSKSNFLKIMPTFHGDPTISVIPSENGKNYDV